MAANVDAATRPTKLPGPDHPITVEPNPARVIVRIAGRIVADTYSKCMDIPVSDGIDPTVGKDG